jgi:hypothetical protein
MNNLILKTTHTKCIKDLKSLDFKIAAIKSDSLLILSSQNSFHIARVLLNDITRTLIINIYNQQIPRNRKNKPTIYTIQHNKNYATAKDALRNILTHNFDDNLDIFVQYYENDIDITNTILISEKINNF